MEKKTHKYTEQEAYQKLSALCALAEYCCWDMMKKMKNWEFEDNDCKDEIKEHIISKLVSERFIDESRFAKAFVRDKFRYNHWGVVRIQQELKMRHIAQKHIDIAIQEIDDDDNLDTLRDIIQKKKSSVKGKSDYEIKVKLIRFAVGRGFKMDDVIKIVGDLDI